MSTVDALALSQEIVPYVTAAVAAYGAAVLTKAEDKAAEATVGLGQRLLGGLLGGRRKDEIASAVTELAADPGDTDLQAALRVRIRKALEADGDLATRLATLLEQRPSGSVSARGTGAVAVGGDVTGIVSTGDGATING